MRPGSHAIEAAVMNLDFSRRVVSSALVAGVLSGFLLTVLQQLWVAELIVEAEKYEQVTSQAPLNEGNHTAHVAFAQKDGIRWMLQGSVQRVARTAVANSALGVGFALLLSAVLVLRCKSVGRFSGLAWGLAGYSAFFVAPSLGLPPELPGMDVGSVAARQVWWIAVALMTAAGLWLLTAKLNWPFQLVACALVLIPHVVGPPMPLGEVAGSPLQSLKAPFIVATAVTNALFWVAIGGFTCFFYGRSMTAGVSDRSKGYADQGPRIKG